MISDEVFKNGKILITSDKNIESDRRTWYNRATLRKIPSVIVNKKTKFSSISVDADPLNGSYLSILLKNQETTISEVDAFLWPIFWQKYERGKTTCSIFNVPNEDVERIANGLYEIYLKAMN